MQKVEKTSRVRSVGASRKTFRNVYRKNRALIGKGYKKVRGSKRLVRMSAAERKKYNPKTNLKLRQALRKKRIKQRLINLKRKRTLRSGLYKAIAKTRKK